MAHSRLEKIGTIYTRITGLIRAGSMKLEDRPMWYEVYQAFPPKYAPSYDRPAPKDPIKSIFYPEDIIRAKFYRTIKNVPAINLNDNNRQSLCQKCIALCKEIQKENNLELDEAFNKVIHVILSEIESKSTLRKEFEKHINISNVISGENEVQIK